MVYSTPGDRVVTCAMSTLFRIRLILPAVLV